MSGVKDWNSKEPMDDCNICSKVVRECDLATAIILADGSKGGLAHSHCLPNCIGPQGEKFKGYMDERSPHQTSNLQTMKCPRCSWLEKAKPGEVWF
jgi:hypothetical protein